MKIFVKLKTNEENLRLIEILAKKSGALIHKPESQNIWIEVKPQAARFVSANHPGIPINPDQIEAKSFFL